MRPLRILFAGLALALSALPALMASDGVTRAARPLPPRITIHCVVGQSTCGG